MNDDKPIYNPTPESSENYLHTADILRMSEDQWATQQPSGAAAGFAVIGIFCFVVGIVVGAAIW